MTTEARPPIVAQAESKEEQRRRLDQELAESNVLRHAECIGEGGQMLLAEARRQDHEGRRSTPASVVIANTLGLGMSLLTNRRAAAMTFKGRAASANRITRVLMERIPLPGQIGQAPAAGEAGPASPTDAAPAQSAELVVRRAFAPVESEGSKGTPATSGTAPAAPETVGAPRDEPSVRPDAPAEKEWELITDDLPPPVISCGSQGADEERADAVLAMALEAEADKGKDQMTSALMRALARSRGNR